MTPRKTTKTEEEKVKTTRAKKVQVVAEEATQTPVAEEEVSVDTAINADLDETDAQGAEKYYESVGRRKTSIARVRLYTKKSTDSEIGDARALIWIKPAFEHGKPLKKKETEGFDGKPYFEYFQDVELQNVVEAPLKKLKSLTRFKATVVVSGGGISGQAEAVRHGLSRALTMFDENFSKKLKKASYLTRDPRAKERKKPGLKKARKSPRWSKR